MTSLVGKYFWLVPLVIEYARSAMRISWSLSEHARCMSLMTEDSTPIIQAIGKPFLHRNNVVRYPYIGPCTNGIRE